MKDHRYQVILKAKLDEGGLKKYLEERNDPKDPTKLIVLANSEDFLMTLPQLLARQVINMPYDMYTGYPPSGHATQIYSGELEVEKVVVFRPLDFFSESSVYPPSLSYYLFGSGDEAHMSHYVSKFPNYQHELSLKAAPDSLTQQELEEGQIISIPELFLSPNESLPDDNPVTGQSYEVAIRGKKGLHAIDLGDTWWYATDELNGSGDEY